MLSQKEDWEETTLFLHLLVLYSNPNKPMSDGFYMYVYFLYTVFLPDSINM